MSEVLGIVFIFVGIIFDFFGCLGLVRLPDVYNRLQASTKCVTLGTASILFGLFLIHGLSAAGIKAILCIVFVVLFLLITFILLRYVFIILSTKKSEYQKKRI